MPVNQTYVCCVLCKKQNLIQKQYNFNNTLLTLITILDINEYYKLKYKTTKKEDYTSFSMEFTSNL